MLFAAWALVTVPFSVTGAFAVAAALAGTVATMAPMPRVLTASIEGTTTFVNIFFMIILSLSVCVLLEYFESNLDFKVNSRFEDNDDGRAREGLYGKETTKKFSIECF